MKNESWRQSCWASWRPISISKEVSSNKMDDAFGHLTCHVHPNALPTAL